MKGSGCGPRDHQRRELRAVAAALPAEAGAPARPVRLADAERAQHARAALRGALAFGGDAAARAAAAKVRRPYPRRCGAGDLQRTRRREAHPRDLRRARRGDALRHGGLQAGGVLRARVSEAGHRQDRRHGAGVARHLHLRRRSARVLRAHDRAGVDGRGIPSEEESLAHRAAAQAGAAGRARRDRQPEARDFRAGRLSDGAESQQRTRNSSASRSIRRSRSWSQKGPATPDHLVFIKPVPMLGRDAAEYAKNYRAYFERHAAKGAEDHARSGAARGARSAARLRRRGARRARGGDHRGSLRPQHRRDPARRGAGRLERRRREPPVRHRVLGPRAGEGA